jgi:hypothetical protein
MDFTNRSIAQVIKMRKLRWFSALAALAALTLAACGGGSSSCDTAFSSCGSSGGGTTIQVSTVVLVTDTPTIPSDNTTPANLTAYVRDANNNFVSGVLVVFTADSGGLAVTQATTDTNGVATATLNTLGDPTNRAVTVTATVTTSTASISGTATVQVNGTFLQLQGPSALTAGQQATYTVTLQDSGKHPISGATVTVTAPATVSVGTTTLTTDSLGQVNFVGTGATGGSGTLSVAALGATQQQTVAVNSDAVSFASPAPNINIDLNTQQVVTVNWSQNGVAVANSVINMATTRGCIVSGAATTCTGQPSTSQVTTDASGNAQITIVSENAGGATISGTVAGGTTGTLAVQFIATTAAFIDVQPDVFTLATVGGTPDTSNITAVVRDVNNNLVTGATVSFTLNDITGGTLTLPTAVTNNEGRASTVYASGSTTSAANGVHVTATVVVNSTPISKTVDLTVARQQVFISIGTGNEIAEPNAAQYEVDYIVQVTDANGAGVANVPLSMSVLSQRYFKGKRVQGTSTWTTCYTIPQDAANCVIGLVPDATVSMGCADEDFNRNGILDPGENNNGNNPATISSQNPLGVPTLEAGNIASVTPANPTTDATGFVLVHVFYPQEYAYYLQVTLQAQATVQGTAFSAMSTFMLAGIDTDFNSLTTEPPGITSPFGKSNTCSNML